MAILNKQTNRDRKVIPGRNNSDHPANIIKIAVNIIAQGCTLFFLDIVVLLASKKSLVNIFTFANVCRESATMFVSLVPD